MDNFSEGALNSLLKADKLILQELGIELLSAGGEKLVLQMNVAENMVNSQGFCHGGFLFSLADTASAYAVGRENLAPATTEASISYLEPATLGDELIAEAWIEERTERLAYTSAKIIRTGGAVVALYRASVFLRGAISESDSH